MKKEGFPVAEVYEEKVKDIVTSRFNKDFDDDYSELERSFQRKLYTPPR